MNPRASPTYCCGFPPADRYEAEFSACKALLIAEQKRAEKAEADRAAAEAERADIKKALHVACKAGRQSEEALAAAEQRASEARAALERNQEAMRLALGTLAPILARFEKRCATGLSGPLDKGESGEGHTPTEHKHLRALRQEIQRMQAAHDAALAALPVERARRQVTEITQEAGTPRAPKVADLAPYKQDCACGWYEFDKGGDAARGSPEEER
jgi:hypothetical protein